MLTPAGSFAIRDKEQGFKKIGQRKEKNKHSCGPSRGNPPVPVPPSTPAPPLRLHPCGSSLPPVLLSLYLLCICFLTQSHMFMLPYFLTQSHMFMLPYSILMLVPAGCGVDCHSTAAVGTHNAGCEGWHSVSRAASRQCTRPQTNGRSGQVSRL